jgi:hypothetical protein
MQAFWDLYVGPEEVHVRRSQGFGLDEKPAVAVLHRRFLPATSRGNPIEARRPELFIAGV